MDHVIQFERPLMSPNPDGTWSLMADWSVYFDGHWFRLPDGFRTDGASIPRLLWRVCGTPMDVPRLYAALVHDWLYASGDPNSDRADADLVYREMLIALGVRRLYAFAEWAALRIFGAWHFRRARKNKEKKT